VEINQALQSIWFKLWSFTEEIKNLLDALKIKRGIYVIFYYYHVNFNSYYNSFKPDFGRSSSKIY